MPEEQACLLLAGTASGDGATDLTAAMTAFPIFFFISGHQRNKFTPTVYPAHWEVALKVTHDLDS